VLDIGAWNGAYSFEAARRGARVLATDHFVWTHPEKRGRERFDIANEALGLNIETLLADVPDITLEKVGAWDIVLFLGVLYHLISSDAGTERCFRCERMSYCRNSHGFDECFEAGVSFLSWSNAE
jgi:tRNA (mo5U34)-methyltransferase